LYNTDSEFVTDFSRLFGNAEWHLHKDWVLNAGGMLERSNLSGEHFSPRAMLHWHFAQGQTLRYGLTQAFRPPSTYEKFSNVRYYDPASGGLLDSTDVARGGVGVEKVLAREIGYLGDFPQVGLNLDVRIFEEEIQDYVKRKEYALSGSGGNDMAFDFVNGENFNTHGVEYQFKWQPWQGGQLIWSQTLLDSRQSVSAKFATRPYSSVGLMLMQRFAGGMDLSLMYHQVDASHFPGVDAESPAMSRTDLRLAWPLRFGAKRGEVSFVVQNLGPAYQDFLPDFYFRRQAYVMLRLDN